MRALPAAPEQKQTARQMLQTRNSLLTAAKITAASCKYLATPVKREEVWKESGNKRKGAALRGGVLGTRVHPSACWSQRLKYTSVL